LSHTVVDQIERTIGRGIGGIFDDQQFGVSAIATILALGCKHEDKRLTRTKVLTLMEESDHPLSYYTEKIGAAVAFVIDPTEGEEDTKDEGEAAGEPTPLAGVG